MELFNTTLTFMITLLTTVSKSNSKLTNDSVSSVLILHSVITPLSSKLQNTNQIKLEFKSIKIIRPCDELSHHKCSYNKTNG